MIIAASIGRENAIIIYSIVEISRIEAVRASF